MNKRSNQPMARSPAAGGFSLIELAVTMTIAAVLAAIAIPAYSNYVRKAHRVEARSTLLDLASLEERWYSTNNNYTATPANLGYPGGAVNTAFTVGSGYYQVIIPSATVTAAIAPTAGVQGGSPATYVITATALNDQAKDTSCATFTVTSAGTQSSTNSANADSTATCWH